MFDKGVDADIAQVQVQNKVQSAVARLPQQVQQQGVTVTKGSPDFLMIVGVYDETDKSTNVDVSDWLLTNLQDDLSRIAGVGDVNVFGSQICDADLARSEQAAKLPAHAERRGHRDPEPEC